MTSELLHDSYFIQPFDGQHALYLLLFLIPAFALLTQHKRIQRHPEPVLKTVLVVSILQQILLYGSYIAEGFNSAEALPLHISRVSSILGIIWLLTRKNAVMDLLFFFGLYAYGSFLYPSRVHPITHPIGWSFLINHVITILLPLLAVIIYRWRPTRRSLLRASLGFLVYLAAAMAVNELTGGNYFYMTKRIAFHNLPLWQYTAVVILFTFLLFAAFCFIANALIDRYFKNVPLLTPPALSLDSAEDRT